MASSKGRDRENRRGQVERNQTSIHTHAHVLAWTRHHCVGQGEISSNDRYGFVSAAKRGLSCGPTTPTTAIGVTPTTAIGVTQRCCRIRTHTVDFHVHANVRRKRGNVAGHGPRTRKQNKRDGQNQGIPSARSPLRLPSTPTHTKGTTTVLLYTLNYT